MGNSKEYHRSEEHRRSLRGHNKDEGYAERYLQTVESRRFLKRDFIQVALVVVALAILIAGLFTGFLIEAYIAILVLGFVSLFVWGCVKMAGIRRQDRLHNQAVQRQNGIDERFGRTGADRKKK